MSELLSRVFGDWSGAGLTVAIGLSLGSVLVVVGVLRLVAVRRRRDLRAAGSGKPAAAAPAPVPECDGSEREVGARDRGAVRLPSRRERTAPLPEGTPPPEWPAARAPLRGWAEALCTTPLPEDSLPAIEVLELGARSRLGRPRFADEVTKEYPDAAVLRRLRRRSRTAARPATHERLIRRESP